MRAPAKWQVGKCSRERSSNHWVSWFLLQSDFLLLRLITSLRKILTCRQSIPLRALLLEVIIKLRIRKTKKIKLISDTISDPLVDISGIGDCGKLCYGRGDCVAAVHDSANRKCYLWSSMIEQRKVAGSGAHLLTAMCPEERAQVRQRIS